MQYTILLLTILLALTQSVEFNFTGSLDVNLTDAFPIGLLSDDLDIGITGDSDIPGAVAFISSDLFVFGTVTIGNGVVSPLLRIGDSSTLYAYELVLNSGEIEMGEGASLYISDFSSLNTDAIFSGYVSLGGTANIGTGVAIYANGTFAVDNLAVDANATLEYSAESAGYISGFISLGSGAVLENSGSIQILGDVSGSGELIFSGPFTGVNCANIEGNVVISGSGNGYFALENTTTLYSDLSVEEYGTLFISTATNVVVKGSASFESGTTYKISIYSEGYEDILTVEGEVVLNGTLYVETYVELITDTVVMYYGSRAEGSIFSEVIIYETSFKRELSAVEYEVEYQADRIVVRIVSGTDSNVDLSDMNSASGSSDVESSDVESSDVESSDVESSDVESSDESIDESSELESSDVESFDESSELASSDLDTDNNSSFVLGLGYAALLLILIN